MLPTIPEQNIDRTLDVRGMTCPLPVLKTKQTLDRMNPGQVLKVISTDPDAESDIPRLFKRLGHSVLDVRKEQGVFTFLIRKEERQTHSSS